MKIYKPILVILLLMLSVSVVAAADTNDTAQDTLDISNTDADVLSADEQTYTDLVNDLNKAGGNITLQKDYAYNKSTDDDLKLIKFNNLNFIIDGNNHRIDGKDFANAFEIKNGSDILIKNLVFTNCIVPLQIYNSKVTTINVTFLNSPANETFGGAVYAEESDYISQNDKFINNYATERGDAIYGYYSKINVTNSEFSNEKPVTWSMIYGSNSILNIAYCTFANTTSKYATAIYNNRDTFISKSKFINLSSNLTAGAVAIKGGSFNTTTKIEDCEFINVKSINNGGAVFIDAAGAYSTTGNTLISNTKFTNCTSGFGGAVLQLGGNLDISNSEFTNNYATESGGAVYTSFTTLNINNSTFTDNVGSLGSAIYFDIDEITINKSTFKNNYAVDTVYGGAITVYDSLYSISDSTFENNTEYDVSSYYENKNSSIKPSGNVKTNLNNTEDSYRIMLNGTQITFNPIKINGSANDSYFNLRDLGLVTPVKDQGSMSSCWAFGTTGAFESAFLIATNTTLDLSENYIRNLELQYSIYGLKSFTEYGTVHMGAANILDWFGGINTEDDVYDELGKVTSMKFTEKTFHTNNIICVPITDKNALKEALTTYGGLNFYVRGATSNEKYYNPKTSALYVNDPTALANHYVTLVGWDDNFSKDNFATPAPGDGAWICKNSWGTEWGDKGYFYVSYYDQSINRSNVDVIGFIIQNDDYETLYQNSIGSFSSFNSDYNEYQTTFTAADNTIISAVGTYFEKANTPYTISIYINNEKVYNQSGNSKFAGFETVKLNEKIAVPYNSTFTVRIKSTSMPILLFKDTRIIPETLDNVVVDGELKNLTDAFTPIKAYTISKIGAILTAPNEVRVATDYYADERGGYYYAVLKDIYGNPLANKTVSLTVAGKTYNVTTDKDGRAALRINLKNAGTYNCKAEFKGDDMYSALSTPFKLTITKKATKISASDKAFKATAKKTIKVTLKTSKNPYDGKVYLKSGKKITLKVNGKTYTAKANSKGVAKFTIKLTKKGKYTAKIKFAGDKTYKASSKSIKITVK